jgi:hypothetical protein
VYLEIAAAIQPGRMSRGHARLGYLAMWQIVFANNVMTPSAFTALLTEHIWSGVVRYSQNPNQCPDDAIDSRLKPRSEHAEQQLEQGHPACSEQTDTSSKTCSDRNSSCQLAPVTTVSLDVSAKDPGDRAAGLTRYP